MKILYNDYNSYIVGHCVGVVCIGTITQEAYNIAFRHFYKLIEVYAI